jgi:UPF0271 protein
MTPTPTDGQSPGIDVNADLGEGFPNDERLLDLVTSASVSCGAHAGDRESILKTLHAARKRGVPVGAHPGYRDREGFGRRDQNLSTDHVVRLILDQFGELNELARQVGVPLRFIKPHGALYNQAQKERSVALGVVSAARSLKLPLLGQPGSECARAAREAGVRFVAEGFPDRRYQPDGRLVPRSRPDAVLEDPGEVEAQIVRLAGQGFETLCIHGDDPRAVRNAECVRDVLNRHGLTRRFWG